MKYIYRFLLISAVLLFSYLSFYSQDASGNQELTQNQNYNSHLDLTTDDSLKSINEMRTKINNLLFDKNLKGTQYGLAIYSTKSQKFLYQRNVERLLTPASNTKLFTTFASMSFLGPYFQIRTSVYYSPEAVRGSQINGDIYIYGRGDINLSINDMEVLAEQIKNMGIKKINGNVYADPTFFDRDFQRSSYSGDNEEVEATGPVYALCLDKNEINVLVKGSRIIGSKANVQIIPNSHSFEVRNSATVGTVAKRSKKNKRAAGNALKVSTSTIGDKTIFSVSGTVSPNQTSNYRFFNKTPEITTAGVLKERLQIMGVEVSGDVKIGKCTALSSGKIKELAYVNSPLIDIIYQVNKKSNNYLAEIVFKIIGGHYGKYPSTAQSAREKIMQVLDSNYIPRKGFMLNDGCGLSRRNLITADGLSKLLIVAKKKKWGNVFDSTLTIAGVDGTLRKRMIGTEAENNLHGKTGTLRNVSSLSGYVNTQNGDEFIFAFIFNGPNVGYYKQIENKIGEIMANFNYYKY